MIFHYEIVLGGRLVRQGDKSAPLLEAGGHLTDRLEISTPAFLTGNESFVVRATAQYETGLGAKADTCAIFTYDPAARVFSPDSGCSPSKISH